MSGNILLDIPTRLLGEPQAPDCPLCVQSNTPDGVAFVAPSGRSFLHIRAGRETSFQGVSSYRIGQ